MMYFLGINRDCNHITNIQKIMNSKQMPDFLSLADSLKKDARGFARVYCLEWFDNSFQNQGFTDAGFVPWQRRKQPDKSPGRAILIDTTFLRKSLTVLQENESQMVFGTHVPYAGLHNNGERQRAIQNARGFYRNRNGKRYQVKPHTRERDVQYPKRQFIGESKLMMQGLNNWLLNEIEKRFKQY